MRASKARVDIGELGRGKSEVRRETPGFKSGEMKLGRRMRCHPAVLSPSILMLGLGLLAASAIMPATARGQIFVINGTTVGEYTTSGATVNASLVSISVTGGGALAVSGSDLFVDNSYSTIGEYTTSGATVNATLVSGLGLAADIAVSGSDLFVANDNEFNGTIGEYTTSGATVNASLVSWNQIGTIALSGSELFFQYAEVIGECTTSGTLVNARLISGSDSYQGVAVSGSDLFVTNYYAGTIGEYTTSGATVNAALVSGLFYPVGIAVSGSDLFVTNHASGTIGEYTTSGVTVNAALISGLGNPLGIAVSTNTNTNIIWASASSGNWDTMANWSPTAVPTSTNDVYFSTGSSTPYTVSLTGASAAKSVTHQGDNVTLAMGGNTLTVGGALTVDGFGGQKGSLALSGPGTVSAAGGVTVTSSGVLSGNATVNGNVSNAGVVSPGSSATPGKLTINGNYSQTGALNIGINGTSPSGNFGSLAVSGTASVGGNLNVTLGNSFSASSLPANGDSYKILSAGSVSGTFSTPGKYIAANFSPNVNPYLNGGSAGLFSATYVSGVPGSPGSVTLSNFHQVDYLGIGVNFTGVTIPGQTTPLRGDLDVGNMGNELFHQTAMPVELYATDSYADNSDQISQDFNQFKNHFKNGVGANDTIVVELSSHGENGLFQISGATGLNSLTPTQIANYIGQLPTTAQKIVIVDCCDSEAMQSALDEIPNAAVLTSTSGTGAATGTVGQPGFNPNGESYTAPDGTGTFTDAILHELHNGVYDLNQILNYVDNNSNQILYDAGGDLIEEGETLDLRE